MAPPKIMIPPISFSNNFPISIFGIAFSSGLRKTSDVGNHPTISKSRSAKTKNRLQRWGFLKLKKSKPEKMKIMTQFRGSMQNCTTFERIKKIVSMITIDLNLLGSRPFSSPLKLALI
jgi:hypothetical protein